MRQTVTITVKTLPLNSGKASLLASVAENYTAAAQWFLDESLSLGTYRMVAVHKTLYPGAREKFPISSTLIQMACQDALRTNKSYTTKRIRNQKGKSKSTEDGPAYRGLLPIAIRRDVWKLARTKSGYALRIPTFARGGGRSSLVAIPLDVSEYHRPLLDGILEGSVPKGNARLILGPGTSWKVQINLPLSSGDAVEPQGWLGVDLGVINTAVTSQGTFFPGGSAAHLKECRARRRAALQSAGRQSRLVATKRKEAHWVEDTNHKIARAIVREAATANKGIALEDLTGITDKATGRTKEARKAIHDWSFNQLVRFIRYKAETQGVPVVTVNPRGTSQRCSRCGHTHKSNRVTTRVFRCRSCGYELNADLNAARNIATLAAANHARRACPVGKGECDTPKGSRPTADTAGQVQANPQSSSGGSSRTTDIVTAFFRHDASDGRNGPGRG